MKIYSSGPYIDTKMNGIISEAFNNGWYDKMDFYNNKAIKMIKKIFNVKYCALFSSCTGALDVLFKSFNFKKDDEIIVPETTWVGTISGLYNQGLKPIFVDVNIDDWNISINSIKKSITKKTKAIVSVDCYGNPSNKKEILSICKKFKLKFIEDAAPGIGSKINNKFCGTFGDAGVFSFQGAKPITSGEGGAIITNNKKIYEKVLYYNDHCRVKNKILFSNDIGFKYKISNLQSALLVTQLNNFNKIIRIRRRNFFYYKKYLKNKEYFFMNNSKKSVFNNYYLPSIVLKKNIKYKSIRSLAKYLKKNSVETRPFFRPLSSLPMFKSKKIKNPNAYKIFKNGINLPSYGKMQIKEIKYVCDLINNYFNKSTLIS
jgi:perosamine synthetase